MNNVLILSDFQFQTWKPLLLFVPVRLGINEINPTYFSSLKACFELEQCVGVIGKILSFGAKIQNSKCLYLEIWTLARKI